MKVIHASDYQDMSKIAAGYVIQKVSSIPTIKLGLATGGTPLGLYSHLVTDYKKNGTSYQNVTTFNLDEYVGLSANHPNSYRYYMNHHLFHHLDIPKDHTHIPRGDVTDLQEECVFYEDIIAKYQGIDLQILGIGRNGHIGFNEPGTSFDSITHLVRLQPSTRKANARFFKTMEEVPTEAITMGIGTIMKSKEILLLVSGESKRDALSKLLSGNVDESFPASVLNNHRNVTIITDQKAIK